MPARLGTAENSSQQDVEIEEEEAEELHDDAIAMLFLIAEHNNPASKSAPRCRTNSEHISQSKHIIQSFNTYASHLSQLFNT